jgi:thioredoxin reductase (NADPH)
MSKPVILAVDDEPDVLSAIERDLYSHFRTSYRIVKAGSGAQALKVVDELKQRGSDVALFMVDERMPEMTGIEFLREAMQLYPGSRKVLLTAYADTETAIKAINEIRLDHYLTKPWDPPSERLYPALDDLLDEWSAGSKPKFEGVRVAGTLQSAESFQIKDFLSSNLFPYQWIDLEKDAAMRELAIKHSPELARLPVVFLPDGTVLVQPDVRSLAERIGMNLQAESKFYDLIVVGGGPAGLAGAVYGASEGLRTVLVESHAPGGQAGTSSRIENYLGFPQGLSGAELARRAVTQAKRFGAEIVAPQEIVEIRRDDPYRVVKLSDGTELSSKAVILAPGMERRLDVAGIARLLGAGVYCAARTEAAAVRGQDVMVVGGELRRPGRHVLLGLREKGLHGPARWIAHGVDVPVPRRPHPASQQHRGAAQHAGDRSRRRRTGRQCHADQRRRPGVRGPDLRPLHLHRHGAADASRVQPRATRRTGIHLHGP